MPNTALMIALQENYMKNGVSECKMPYRLDLKELKLNVIPL